MKIFSVFFSASIIFIVSNNILAQNEKSIAWEISGNNLKTPSYLFGTIHIQDKRVFNLAPKTKEAFEKAKVFAMEIVINPQVIAKVQEMKILPNNKKLNEVLSAKEYKKTAQMTKKYLKKDIKEYQNVRPIFIATEILISQIKKDELLPLDFKLSMDAQKEGKEVVGVENFQSQIDAYNSITMDEEVFILNDYIKNGKKAIERLDQTLDIYLQQDIDELAEMSKDPSYPEKFYKKFILDRNKIMTDNIDKLVQKESTFIAIGSAHLGGTEGVIKLLQNKGYIVKPLK